MYTLDKPEELLKAITMEVKKYTGQFKSDRITYGYNRMTVEEIAQEVFIKILRSVNKELNKSYIRQAVIYVCLDLYRKKVEDDEWCLSESDALSITEEETFRDILRSLQLHQFSDKELRVIDLLIQGKRNPEIREELKIPKMSYYTLLNKIRETYTELNSLRS